MEDFEIIIVLIVAFCFSILIFCCKALSHTKSERQVRSSLVRRMQRYGRLETNQQEDIYNISSRVQGQGQWPTHDNHVSLDHFTIANEINKYNDDPPTYEEAISIAASNNNNSVVPAVVPKSTTPPPPPFPTDDESTTVSASASTRN